MKAKQIQPYTSKVYPINWLVYVNCHYGLVYEMQRQLSLLLQQTVFPLEPESFQLVCLNILVPLGESSSLSQKQVVRVIMTECIFRCVFAVKTGSGECHTYT